ncbi:hypothetical protein [Citromicrobium sp. WPS32]|uniref:hypothetical protein n=1 Tax=Citromicrobium sp. WPS32 TaxID=1634517 RepID=UPI000A71BAB3|nr:hypothetical protein [Citromicrobium sp. WPS32]
MGKSDKPEKTAFVICPIGKEGGTSRKRSDRLLKYVIREVLEPKGYIVERADQLSEPGIITNQIVQKIVDCDILLADLSEGNPNVFYEFAIRHGLKKPFIHMIDASEKIPFDNAQVRTIQFDLADLDSVANVKLELGRQVDSIESGKSNAESPISVAFDLEQLRASGNTDQSVLAALFDEVSAMRSEMRSLRRIPTRKGAMPSPATEKEIYSIVSNYGKLDLIDKFSSASITSIEPGKLSLVTTLGKEEDFALEEELSELLISVTGRPWTVSVLPF